MLVNLPSLKEMCEMLRVIFIVELIKGTTFSTLLREGIAFDVPSLRETAIGFIYPIALQSTIPCALYNV